MSTDDVHSMQPLTSICQG